ncbi:hypothetical protein MPH_01196 [Macrophomina phaseolina MS6]|uniref:Uncharacterized protein n=1 Tax=Macrophomina phaseolina (strain MS6) TaxID=1126212 RepID=K2SY26_MACPH|nr:hypothetical protein MPH_01196 [Macrophomina phaseolina MS6]
MVTINVAYTAPINPAGATPVLTVEQVWSSLAHKIHNPSSFVPVIASTRVISESTEDSIPVVTREVTFKEGFRQQGATVQEVCKSYEPTRVLPLPIPTPPLPLPHPFKSPSNSFPPNR